MARGDFPTLLSGDFNEWQIYSKQLRLLKQQMHMVQRKRTFPARYPIFALDRIFYNTGLELLEHNVHITYLSRQASDHLPLIGHFTFAKQ